MNDEEKPSYRALLGQAVDSAIAACTPENIRWNYENGLILRAILEASSRHLSHRHDRLARNLVDVLVAPDGSIKGYKQAEYNLDQINAGKVVFDMWAASGEPRYEKALGTLMAQLALHPRTNSGSFWHKKIYPYQVWLDGLYMFGPFYARYAREFARPELFEDLCSQFSNVEKVMRDRDSGLYFHAWDESRVQRWADPATGLSPHVWGRAVGWLSMALIDTLDYLPAEHPRAARLAAMFHDLIGAVAVAQDSSGLWFQVMDCPNKAGNYREESASAMFAYALFKGMRTGLLDRVDFGATADRALGGLVSRFLSKDDSGALHVNGICKVAGLGGEPYRDGSFAYYIGEPVVSDDYKGLGPFILALCEALGA